MVDSFPDIPLGKICEDGTFRDDHAEHSVDVFNPGFLVAAHGIAIVDACPLEIIYPGLKGYRIPKLTASVCFMPNSG